VGGAVVPRCLELELDAAVRQQLQAVVADGGSRTVAQELLAAGVVAGADGDGGVQVEAVELGVVSQMLFDERRLGACAEPGGAATSPWADGVALDDGSGVAAGQERSFVAQLIEDVFVEQAMALQEGAQAADQVFEYGVDLDVAGGRQGVEAQRTVGLLAEDAIEGLGVEVRIEIEGGAEAQVL
jgi:hypothetical protein